MKLVSPGPSQILQVRGSDAHAHRAGAKGKAAAQDDGESEHEHDSDSQRSPASPHRRSSKGGSGSNHAMGAGYLRSKLWWLGLGLMTLGEFGNFLCECRELLVSGLHMKFCFDLCSRLPTLSRAKAYGFAPASLVAPLGAVALLSNVLISPLLLGERFRASDLTGIALAIIGAVTVVFSSKQNDERLSPDTLLAAIKRLEFVIYAAVSAGVGVLLALASTTRAGDKFVIIDVGVCAVFGAFTVLSTKAISSLLSRSNPFDMLRYPITYPVLFVLVATAVLQVTYLNRALQRFDSRQVIPTQFVLFTISAIVGSAVLYRDFEDVDAHRLINFLFGCLTTFGGVFLLTRSKGGDDHHHHDEEDEAHERERRRERRAARAKRRRRGPELRMSRVLRRELRHRRR